jgi:mRNA-degrading endonuclease toxin of MazEF toxin-antitoxin module
MAGAVDVRALGTHVGHLAVDELRAVEDAVMLVLDLN